MAVEVEEEETRHEEAALPEDEASREEVVTEARTPVWPILRRTFLNALQAMVVSGTLLFVSAGRLDIPSFWIYQVVQFCIFLALGVPLVFKSPGLMKERWKAGSREVKGAHKAWRMFNRILSYAVFIAAGLDVGRFHLLPAMPVWVQVLGGAMTVGGAAIIVWSMRTNYFFSTVVRIQKDRGQKVITSGPYGFVRHPGYVGMILRVIGLTALLGSWLSVLVSFLYIPLFVVRTILEDRMLHEELEGYEEYASQVRYRLVPVVW